MTAGSQSSKKSRKCFKSIYILGLLDFLFYVVLFSSTHLILH